MDSTAARIRGEAERHPLVQAVLEQFPGAEIREVRDVNPDSADAESDDDDNERDETEQET